jgi:hypothetical protein
MALSTWLWQLGNNFPVAESSVSLHNVQGISRRSRANFECGRVALKTGALSRHFRRLLRLFSERLSATGPCG